MIYHHEETTCTSYQDFPKWIHFSCCRMTVKLLLMPYHVSAYWLLFVNLMVSCNGSDRGGRTEILLGSWLPPFGISQRKYMCGVAHCQFCIECTRSRLTLPVKLLAGGNSYIHWGGSALYHTIYGIISGPPRGDDVKFIKFSLEETTNIINASSLQWEKLPSVDSHLLM